jgi:hypothetical protein
MLVVLKPSNRKSNDERMKRQRKRNLEELLDEHGELHEKKRSGKRRQYGKHNPDERRWTILRFQSLRILTRQIKQSPPLMKREYQQQLLRNQGPSKRL